MVEAGGVIFSFNSKRVSTGGGVGDIRPAQHARHCCSCAHSAQLHLQRGRCEAVLGTRRSGAAQAKSHGESGIATMKEVAHLSYELADNNVPARITIAKHSEKW